MFQAAVDHIAEHIEPQLLPRVYSYRYNSSDTKDEYFFLPHIEQWKKLLYQIKDQIVSDQKILVVMDIANYFDNISIKKLSDLLKKWLRKGSPIQIEELDKTVDLIESILNAWKTFEWTHSGIPQNRDACSFLANIYLKDIDNLMEKRNYNYYRYMDDIRIVCNDHYHGRRAIMHFTEFIADLGLNVNSSKTRIMTYDPGTSNEELNKHFPEDNKILEQIDNLIATKRAREVQMAVTMTINFFDEVIEEETKKKSLDFRHFTFCISRLQLFAQVKSLKVLIDFAHIVETLIPRFESHPWLTDVYVKFLMSVDKSYFTKALEKEISLLVIDDNKNVYSWQAFHLWKLLTFHKIGTEELQKRALHLVINENGKMREAEIGAAIIYLAATDFENSSEEIIRSFNTHMPQDEMLRRCFIIALQKVDPKEIDFKDQSELAKMHDAIRSSPNFNAESPEYVSSLPSLSLNEIFRNLPDKVST